MQVFVNYQIEYICSREKFREIKIKLNSEVLIFPDTDHKIDNFKDFPSQASKKDLHLLKETQSEGDEPSAACYISENKETQMLQFKNLF